MTPIEASALGAYLGGARNVRIYLWQNFDQFSMDEGQLEVVQMKEFFIVLKRWRGFSGRSFRGEYCNFTPVLVVTSFLTPMLDA